MSIYHSVTELIGRTPLVELTGYEKKHHVPAEIVAKVELFNPAGSIKDRIAAADHRIVPDRRSGQFVNFVQNIHFRKSVTVFERKVTPEIKKINGETARDEKKICVSRK